MHVVMRSKRLHFGARAAISTLHGNRFNRRLVHCRRLSYRTAHAPTKRQDLNPLLEREICRRGELQSDRDQWGLFLRHRLRRIWLQHQHLRATRRSNEAYQGPDDLHAFLQRLRWQHVQESGEHPHHPLVPGAVVNSVPEFQEQ